METDRPRATPRGMPPLVTALVAFGLGASLLPVASASPAGAGLNRPREAVRSGADGYTPWGNIPARGPISELGPHTPEIEPKDGPGMRCHADGMGGCVVPVCGEALAAGECQTPAVAITVTPSWSTTAAPPHEVPLRTASVHGIAIASAARRSPGRSAQSDQARGRGRRLELEAATGQLSLGERADRSWQG